MYSTVYWDSSCKSASASADATAPTTWSARSALSFRIGLEVFEEALVALLIGNFPLRLDGLKSLFRGERIVRDHAGEIAIAHHFHARHLFSGVRVKRLQALR